MSQFIDLLEKKGIKLPQNVVEVLENCAGYTVYNTVDELHVAAVGGPDNLSCEVSYEIPGKDRKSTRLNSSHLKLSRMPSSA